MTWSTAGSAGFLEKGRTGRKRCQGTHRGKNKCVRRSPAGADLPGRRRPTANRADSIHYLGVLESRGWIVIHVVTCFACSCVVGCPSVGTLLVIDTTGSGGRSAYSVCHRYVWRGTGYIRTCAGPTGSDVPTPAELLSPAGVLVALRIRVAPIVIFSYCVYSMESDTSILPYLHGSLRSR